MRTHLSAEVVAELRRLYAEATPGVWKLWGMTVLADQDGTSNVDTAVEVAQTFFRDEDGKPRTWDADLIAMLHNHAAALLDAAEAARETTPAEVGLRKAVEALAADLCDFHGGHGDFLTAGKSLRALLAEHPTPAPEAEVAAGEREVGW